MHDADHCKLVQCTVGDMEKFPFRLRATVLAFPFNDTQTVIQRYVPFRSVSYPCHFI